MTLEEALASIENDGIRLGAGDYVSVEALKVAADVLRKAINGNPVIPGCDDQYNIAEMSYNNGYAKGCEDSKPKWIPVTERLPTPYVDVITCRRDFLARATTIGKEYITIGDNEIPSWSQDYRTWKSKVTHWMPLPELPKEV